MGQRPRHGLLGGLWEFVSSEFQVSRNESRGRKDPVSKMIHTRTGLNITLCDAELLGTVKHAFTHFRMTRHIWLIETRCGGSLQPNGYDQLRWVRLDDVKQLALTRSDQKILHLYETHRLSLFAQAR
jgi:adenine-specific DNA glycosylase